MTSPAPLHFESLTDDEEESLRRLEKRLQEQLNKVRQTLAQEQPEECHVKAREEKCIEQLKQQTVKDTVDQKEMAEKEDKSEKLGEKGESEAKKAEPEAKERKTDEDGIVQTKMEKEKSTVEDVLSLGDEEEDSPYEAAKVFETGTSFFESAGVRANSRRELVELTKSRNEAKIKAKNELEPPALLDMPKEVQNGRKRLREGSPHKGELFTNNRWDEKILEIEEVNKNSKEVRNALNGLLTMRQKIFEIQDEAQVATKELQKMMKLGCREIRVKFGVLNVDVLDILLVNAVMLETETVDAEFGAIGATLEVELDVERGETATRTKSVRARPLRRHQRT
ncbi:hypothetical protein niasHT_013942 [Heterodera trifolii]|uniref:Uncharacterized protein n=1 Tax=Heterodera trifolii TaxID=157864 RepID=A0ABD2L1R0_9BILA